MLCAGDAYADVLTLSQMCKYSAGSMYFYPHFKSPLHPSKEESLSSYLLFTQLALRCHREIPARDQAGAIAAPWSGSSPEGPVYGRRDAEELPRALLYALIRPNGSAEHQP